MFSPQTSVIKEMEELQGTLKVYYHRVEVIENNLKSSHLSAEVRESMEKELQDITTNLANLENSLSTLRGQNSKTFAFAVLLMCLSFLGYGLYLMIFGQS